MQDDYHASLDPVDVVVRFGATQLVRQLSEVNVKLQPRQGEVRRLEQQQRAEN